MRLRDVTEAKGRPRRRGWTVVRLDAAALWKRLALLNHSQNWFAREIGISPGYLSLLVNEWRAPSGRIRRRMQKALGVEDFHELYRLKEDMTTNTNSSSRFGGSVELTPDEAERLPYGSLASRRLSQAARKPEGGQRPHLERLCRRHRRRLQADVPVAQRGRRAERGSHALPLPVRKRDARRTGHPHGPGVPYDLLQ